MSSNKNNNNINNEERLIRATIKHNRAMTQIRYLITRLSELSTLCFYLETNQNENVLYKDKVHLLKMEIDSLNALKFVLIKYLRIKADEINEIQLQVYGADVVMAAYQQEQQQEPQQNVQLMM